MTTRGYRVRVILALVISLTITLTLPWWPPLAMRAALYAALTMGTIAYLSWVNARMVNARRRIQLMVSGLIKRDVQ